MLAEKKAPQQVSAAMLIPFRRERARALRVLALAAITTTTAPQGTTRRCADEQPSPHDRDASLDPRSLARFILGTGTDGTSGGSCFSLFTVHTVILGKVAPAAIGFYCSMADSYIAVVRAS